MSKNGKMRTGFFPRKIIIEYSLFRGQVESTLVNQNTCLLLEKVLKVILKGKVAAAKKEQKMRRSSDAPLTNE